MSTFARRRLVQSEDSITEIRTQSTEPREKQVTFCCLGSDI